MPINFRNLDSIIITGTIISIGLALILVFIGEDKATSMLVGLVTSAITLLIDVIYRLRETERKILQVHTLGERLSDDPKLFSTLKQLGDDYLLAKEHQFNVFLQRADNALLECRDIIHSLREGHMTVDIKSKFTFGRHIMNETKKSFKTVQYANPSFWRTRHGERYLQSNGELIKRGVSITRVWIHDQKTLDEYHDVIKKQIEIGVIIFIALPDELPPDLQMEEFGIADDRVVFKLALSREGQAITERISIDPTEVEKAISNFDLLLRFVKTPKEVFSDEVGAI